MTQTMQTKLRQLLELYSEQLPSDVVTKVLSNLRSPAPLFARFKRWMRKGVIRPTTVCLPPAE